ncbi:MmgE/PrpD family protein [Georgenia sp. AZ-5]|uniref:MmgE/PrpD family protein n=1 Tax=Georgenia sp. AZ-5 TaxID=3367526 RepID=UPI003754F448
MAVSTPPVKSSPSMAFDLADVAADISYDGLPAHVIAEGKRVLLDSIGCTVAGLAHDKGRVGVELGRRLGGAAEATILGTGERVSMPAAAFANGELMNAHDFDAIHRPPGHIVPYVIPGVLAAAESAGVTGKDLIVATVLAHEIAGRLSIAMPFKKVTTDAAGNEVITYSNLTGAGQCAFGTTVAMGGLLGYDRVQLANAIGLTGHVSNVPTGTKFAAVEGGAWSKYGAAGWISSNAVTATLAAGLGFVGDTTVFEGEHGWWRMVGAQGWDPADVMTGLGTTWTTIEEIAYKLYPACYNVHSSLDALIGIIDGHGLRPEDIGEVRVFMDPQVERKPYLQTSELTPLAAQFMMTYCAAVAVHRIPPGAAWQDVSTLADPGVRAFMDKVTVRAHPGYEAAYRADRRSSLARVEVVAGGRTFTEERMYPGGTPFTDARATDEQLDAKFLHNVSRVLTEDQAARALAALRALEQVTDVRDVVALLNP